ncbi:hypothetical protein ACHMW6_06400 [Pseudoduganella sp. UC29_106]|uniref:hypothetical protein n=1 Tax=Pseudoduganella sp. UC29_106 TaxID=3374553 RepID=UPI0037566B68
MKRLRGGGGLGDSLYVRPICDELIRRGEEITVLTNFADVFIGSGAKVVPFSRDNVQILAHYVSGKSNPDTNQWQDVCNSAGVQAPMQFQWGVRNEDLASQARDRAAGRPIILAHGGRKPMGRMDGFAMDLMPERAGFEVALGGLSDCLTISVGGTVGLEYDMPVEWDLTGKTNVSDLLDLASLCDGVVAQCSFAVPMAECFDKPLLAIWSQRAAGSNQAYIRTITPQKVFEQANFDIRNG